MVFARGVPAVVSRAAVRNVVITEGDFGGEDFAEAYLAREDFIADIPAVVEAGYERLRLHPYSKPPAVYEHILRRVVRRGDRSSTGSLALAAHGQHAETWTWGFDGPAATSTLPTRRRAGTASRL
jgi:hypothetical protein